MHKTLNNVGFTNGKGVVRVSELTERKLGKRIREIREKFGFTQEFIADKLSVSRPSVSQIESGNRKVTSIELKVLSDVFGVSLHSFFDGDTPSPAIALLRTQAGLSEKDKEEILRFDKLIREFQRLKKK